MGLGELQTAISSNKCTAVPEWKNLLCFPHPTCLCPSMHRFSHGYRQKVKMSMMKSHVSVPALTSARQRSELCAGPCSVNAVAHQQQYGGAMREYSYWEFHPLQIIEEWTDEILKLWVSPETLQVFENEFDLTGLYSRKDLNMLWLGSDSFARLAKWIFGLWWFTLETHLPWSKLWKLSPVLLQRR